jgi:hypothetical protein
MKSHVERLMILRRGVSAAFCSLLFTATLAWGQSAGGSTTGGMSPMTWLFLVFLGAIVLLQLVPALVLFSSLIVSIFKRSSRKTEAASTEEA